VLSSAPAWEGPIFDPDPALVDASVTASINVTYFLGVENVWIDIDGTNQSMTPTADTYTFTWTPTTTGNVTYYIYMESSIGTWSSTTGTLEVVVGGIGGPIDPTMLIIILAAAGAVVVIILIVILKRKK
jgi:hypothetical protein